MIVEVVFLTDLLTKRRDASVRKKRIDLLGVYVVVLQDPTVVVGIAVPVAIDTDDRPVRELLSDE